MAFSLTSLVSSNEPLDWKDLQVIRPNGFRGMVEEIFTTTE